MEDRHTDGNGEAGLLAEVFAVEATVLVRRCAGCGEDHPLGAHRAYRGAGVVLRCPGCGDVGVRIVDAGDRRLVQVLGTLTVPAAVSRPG